MLLFVLQCLLMAALVFPWLGRLPAWNGAQTLAACFLLVAGIAFFIWILRHNRSGNFSFLPEPPPGNRLVTSGPYRYIRHPMYLALLTAMLAMVLLYGETWRWLAWALLGLVLHVKAGVEERLLAARFPEYRAYQARSKRILPFLL